MSVNTDQFEFTRMVGKLLTYAAEQGLDVSIREVWRTLDRQRSLVAHGLSQRLHSLHLKALAVDLVLFRNGKVVKDSNDEGWLTLGLFWESLGGRWGGRWSSLNDVGHFEFDKDGGA